jgi:hypothetical protein
MGSVKFNYLLMSCSFMQVEELSDKIDDTVEPVIEELEDFKPNPTSSSGSGAQK